MAARGKYNVRTIDTLDPTLGAAPITVTFPEVKDFQKQIKFAENDVKKEARNANKDIADRVVQLARRNSWMAYHPRQYEAPDTGATRLSRRPKSGRPSSSGRRAPSTPWVDAPATSSDPAARADGCCFRRSALCNPGSEANTPSA